MHSASPSKTAALHNIGTDLVFPPGKHEAVLSMPVKDAEKAKNACLLLTVEDEPEAAIGAAFRKVRAQGPGSLSRWDAEGWRLASTCFLPVYAARLTRARG